MSDIECIIVEDEPLAVKVLKDYIAEVSFLKLKAVFKDAIDATEYLRSHQVDLIFLDIHLPKLKGMAFLKTLQKAPNVIITTAYHQYAVQGYELNVTDYLMKPIAFDRFLQAVNKVKTIETNKEVLHKDFLILNVQKKKVKVRFSDILYVESQREYVKVVTPNKILRSKMSTSEMEALLPPDSFKRIHRSFIAAIDKIEAYNTEIVEIQGTTIPVGRKYKDVLADLFL